MRSFARAGTKPRERPRLVICVTMTRYVPGASDGGSGTFSLIRPREVTATPGRNGSASRVLRRMSTVSPPWPGGVKPPPAIVTTEPAVADDGVTVNVDP